MIDYTYDQSTQKHGRAVCPSRHARRVAHVVAVTHFPGYLPSPASPRSSRGGFTITGWGKPYVLHRSRRLAACGERTPFVSVCLISAPQLLAAAWLAVAHFWSVSIGFPDLIDSAAI